MKNRLNAVLLVVLCSLTAGCTTIVENLSTKPITDDPATRTVGTWIDDHTLETVVMVNIHKADCVLKKQRIKAVSYNGTVLLIGQVATRKLKNLAAKTAESVSNVSQLYDELTIGPNATFMEQSNDSWITTMAKGKLMSNDEFTGSIKVYTEKGTVYLMGAITPEQSQIAVDTIKKVTGVKKIVKVLEYL